MNSTSLSLDSSLTVFASAKINLHLEVLGLRKDGFHELAMVMQSIDLEDQIEISEVNNGQIKLVCNDKDLSVGDDNLIVKAAKLIKRRSGLENLGALIHLTKNIPIGAGLAGGSSDAAAALVGLNKFWKLKFSEGQLEEMASDLGSDVPFCISGGTQLCFGRGERLEPINVSSSKMGLVLIKDPSVSVSTPWAYARYREINGKNYLSNEVDFEKKRKQLREVSWLRELGKYDPPPLMNDLQTVVQPVTPAVEQALSFLVSLNGNLAVAMSGSGSGCFGLFPDFDSAKEAFDSNRKGLQKCGLQGWCCRLSSKGIRLSK
ncbi:4-diphosphocytidyl-2-C-methyl-D-erythritol kinase [Prochlorococcus sp. MIT 0601]|nr:4-diphosphocytidyl-2-C-methyl-D-erythritol kinase [Prochlorococcus sp. MIT 0601]